MGRSINSPLSILNFPFVYSRLNKHNLKSQRIEQAIFILRDEKDYSEADAVIEAERIVDSYLENMRRPLLEKNAKKQELPRFWRNSCLSIVRFHLGEFSVREILGSGVDVRRSR